MKSIVQIPCHLAVANVAGGARRLISVVVAIALGVAFVAATLMTSDSLRSTLDAEVIGAIGDADVVVTSEGLGTVPGDLPEQVRAAFPSGQIRAVAEGTVTQDLGSHDAVLVVRSVPAMSTETTMSTETQLAQGRLPRVPGEIALSASTAQARHIGVGDTIGILPPHANDVAEPTKVPVVGLIDVGRDIQSGTSMPLAFAADADVWAWSGTPGYAALHLFTGGAGERETPEQARDRLAALPAAHGLEVRTGAQAIEAGKAELGAGTKALTSMLLAFAAVALFVSTLVIANTFSILIAGRTRSLALLRAVGAGRAHVWSAVLLEALVVGLIGSVLGVVLGAGLTLLLVTLSKGSPMELAGFTAGPGSVLVPPAVGVAVTVLASLVPARVAGRVAPVAAMRSDVESTSARVRAGRVIIGALLAVAGFSALAYGGYEGDLVVGMFGGVTSFVGVLVLGPVLVPAVSHLCGALPAAVGGVPGALAVENARRNPRRAASTAGALLVGVTLITMMVVGAASGTSSVLATIDEEFPVDGIVQASAPLTQHEVQAAAAAEHVAASTLVGGVAVTMTTPADGTDGTQVRTLTQDSLLGVDTNVTDVNRNPEVFAGLGDNVVLLPPDAGVATGDRVTVRTAGTSIDLVADVSESHLDGATTTLATVRRLDPEPQSQIWVRYADGADPQAASESLTEAMANVPGAQVSGSVTARAEIGRIIDIVLMVVTGLLAMAVVIAVVGIGNTLGLSVLERRREIGLLRALGLTKGAVRRMLATEAVLLAGTGTVLGIVLGLVYGIAGTHALLAEIGNVVVDIPWSRLLLVAAVALIAGWLASVVPARRASHVSPSAALAAE